MKHLMLKCERDGSDPYLALLEQRNTPRQDTNLSPNQMLLGRQTRTFLPTFHGKIMKSHISRKRENRRRSVKKYYDKTAKSHPSLKANENVYFEVKNNIKWILGKVVKQTDTNTYILKSQDGVTYRRNRLHIRPTEEVTMRDKSPVRVTESGTQHLPQASSVSNSAVTPDELFAPDNDNSDNTTDTHEVID